MPELPEVETIRKGLVNLVGGAVIIDVAVFWDRMITPPFSTERFKTVLRGEQINTIERRGKYLIFLLDHWAMISHLRMEGKYEVSESGEPIKKHTHVIFYLADCVTLTCASSANSRCCRSKSGMIMNLSKRWGRNRPRISSN